MKRFILKAALFTLLVFGTLLGVIYIPPVDSEKYIWALVDKHRLLATVPRPRLIFAGDSNLAFGLNSRLIKNALHVNVINMGLHGGLGLIYSMDELKPYLHAGDTVILIPDYTHYAGPGIGDNTLIEISIVMPRILCTYSKQNIRPFISNIPFTFQRRFRGLLFPSKEDRTHRRSNFNEFGDNEGHIGLPQPAVFKDVEYLYKVMPQLASMKIERFLPDRLNDDLVARLNEFHDYCRARGVTIYIGFPPLMEGNREKQETILRSLEADLKQRVAIPLIGDPLNYIYPRDYFFDNEFHLNGTGREIRTTRLIQDMKAILPQK